LRNIDQTDLQRGLDIQSHLNNMGVNFNLKKVLKEILEHNAKHKLENWFYCIMRFEHLKNIDQVILKPKPVQIPKKNINKKEKKGWLGYILGGVLLAMSLTLTCIGGGTIMTALASACFKSGLNAICNNYKMNRDGTYDSTKILTEAAKTGGMSLFKDLKLDKKVADFMKNVFPGKGMDIVNYSMQGLREAIGKENIPEILNKLIFDNEHLKQEEKKMEKKNEETMKEEGNKKVDQHVEKRDKIEKIPEKYYKSQEKQVSQNIQNNSDYTANLFDQTWNQGGNNTSFNDIKKNMLKGFPGLNEGASRVHSIINNMSFDGFDSNALARIQKNTFNNMFSAPMKKAQEFLPMGLFETMNSSLKDLNSREVENRMLQMREKGQLNMNDQNLVYNMINKVENEVFGQSSSNVENYLREMMKGNMTKALLRPDNKEVDKIGHSLQNLVSGSWRSNGMQFPNNEIKNEFMNTTNKLFRDFRNLDGGFRRNLVQNHKKLEPEIQERYLGKYKLEFFNKLFSQNR
jgi:hypothetical protein